MGSAEIQKELSRIETVGDVIEFSANTILGGKFKETKKDDFWDGKGQEFHIMEGDRIVCRIIEVPEDGATFRDVKNKLKRQGKKAGELFSVLVRTTEDEKSLTEREVIKNLTFVRVESRISSESVDVKHDLRYFEVDLDNIEPLYIDYLDNLQVGRRSVAEMEQKVTEVFSIKRITKRFYKDFSDIFHNQLKPAINGLENEEDNLTPYTQLVVNRILFLMFVQEKGWLNENKTYIQDRYQEIREDDERDAYADFFKPLFFEALNNTEDTPDHLGKIPYLNGGLFEERDEEENVSIDEEFFEALLSPEEDEYGDKEGFLLQYKLSLSESNPAEQELVVDPEFIGRIFEMFMQSEDRKEKGAFYTPKEITQYMSKNSLKQLLLNEFPEMEEEISQLVLNYDVDNFSNNQLKTIQDKLEEIKVLDPAVGSGAFIIATMEELVQIQEAINEEIGEKEDRFNLKEEMIARNLYGVDIDPSGIELCKFRTWLHLIQDLHLDLEELLEENDRYALPNLDFKFFVGNSLAGDFKPSEVIEKFKEEGDYQTTLNAQHTEENSIIQRIAEKRQKFTDAHGDDKVELEGEINNLTEELEESIDWSDSDYYMEEIVKKAGSEFKWSVKMPEAMAQGGFDIVIGNPPYQGNSKFKMDYIGDLSTFYDQRLEYYHTIPRMRHDLYQKFILRGEELVKEDGIFTYITSRTYFTLGSKETTRHILQKNELKQLVDANPDIFDASVEPAIFCLRKTTTDSYNFVYVDGRESEQSDYKLFTSLKATNRDEEIDTSGNSRAYSISIDKYRESFRRAFFEPTSNNLTLHERFMKNINSLAKEWEKELRDSETLEEHQDIIEEEHLNHLDQGDTTILGLITKGGQGLATGRNRDYIAYLEGTKGARRIKEKNGDSFDYVKQNENTIGRAKMGRVIKKSHLADYKNLSKEEKLEGVDSEEKSWIPIEKGFKKKDRFFKPITECINWSKSSVEEMRDKSGAYLKNLHYNFKEGVFISVGGFANLYARYSNNRIIDHTGTFLIPLDKEKTSAKFLTGLLNSRIPIHITETFINSSGMETTDLRYIPIPLPKEEQRDEIEGLVEEAIEIQKGEKEGEIENIKENIDEICQNVYQVNLDE